MIPSLSALSSKETAEKMMNVVYFKIIEGTWSILYVSFGQIRAGKKFSLHAH